jgi:hypothetical protein
MSNAICGVCGSGICKHAHEAYKKLDTLRALLSQAEAREARLREIIESVPEPFFSTWDHNFGAKGVGSHCVIYGVNSFTFDGPDSAVLCMVNAARAIAQLKSALSIPAAEGMIPDAAVACPHCGMTLSRDTVGAYCEQCKTRWDSLVNKPLHGKTDGGKP